MRTRMCPCLVVFLAIAAVAGASLLVAFCVSAAGVWQ